MPGAAAGPGRPRPGPVPGPGARRRGRARADAARARYQVQPPGAAGGPGLADHHQVRGALDQAAERPPDPDVVIDDQDPEPGCLARLAGRGLLHVGSYVTGLVAIPLDGRAVRLAGASDKRPDCDATDDLLARARLVARRPWAPARCPPGSPTGRPGSWTPPPACPGCCSRGSGRCAR